MLVFDLDGTLLDSNGIWTQIDVDFLGQRGLTVTQEYNDFVAHAIFPTAAAFTKEYYGLDESPEEIMDGWRALARDAYGKALPLKPGARACLERFQTAGETMALFTACEPTLCRAALERLALERYFCRVVYAQELNVEKRSPEAYVRLCRMLGETPENCTMIDDSPVACRAAKAAGMTVIGVYDPFFASDRENCASFCHRYVDRLEELTAPLTGSVPAGAGSPAGR